MRKKPKAGQIWKSKHSDDLIQLIDLYRTYPIEIWNIELDGKVKQMEQEDLIMFYELVKPNLVPESHRMDKIRKSKFKR